MKSGVTRGERFGYAQFYEARGRQAMWLTANVAYRLGAALAVPAARCGMSPNMVSLASLLTALGGAVWTVYLGYGSWAAAVILFVSGQIAYGLDCADGVLARVTGRGSPFGAILDKAVDTIVGIALPLILAVGAWPAGASREAIALALGSLALMLAARMGLAVSMWLREAVEKRQRTAADGRQRTRGFYVKQAVGNLVLDDVSFRTLLAISWATGWFWELTAVLGVLLTLMLGVYLAGARRQMTAV